jgi:succinoglycan biosynthesis transport protein ExoP
VVSHDADKPEPGQGPSQPNPAPLRLVGGPRPPRHLGPRRPAALLAPPPAVSSGPDVKSMLRAVRRRWLLASSVGVLAMLVVGITLLILLPQKFNAVATLQITAFQDYITGKPPVHADHNIMRKTQETRFKGQDVLIKAVSDDKVRNLGIMRRFPSAREAVTWLQDDLKVDTQENNEIMTITLPGDDAEELVVVVDALTRAYLSIINGKERGQREEKVKKLQEIANQTKEKLKEKITFRDSKAKGMAAGSASLNLKESYAMQQLAEARRMWTTSLFEATKIEAKLAGLKAGYRIPNPEDIPDGALQPLMEANSTLRPQLMQLGNIMKTLSRMQQSGTPETNPSFRELHDGAVALQKEIREVKAKVRAEVLKGYRKKLDGEFKAEVLKLESELKPHEKQAKKAEEQIDALVRETEAIGRTTAELDVLKVEIGQLEREHGQMEEQLRTLQIELDAAPRVTSCQDAVWQVKDARRRLMILAAVPLMAGFAGAVLVGWLEFRARRIDSADEVAVGLGMRVVGAVPALSAAGRRQLLGADEESYDHNLIESIDALRTTLLRSAREEPTKLVMVTSAVSGEGKTTVASNLAVSLARAGRRTLLIDCDLRRPALHQLFEQTLQPGFSEVLLGEVELPDAVRPTTTDDHLWLMPAGQWDRAVIQELARDSLTALLERLKDEFDFVVVDSHPVLPATDSLLIGQHADAVIVSLLRSVSQAPRVYAACQRLATLGIRVFGAVVNGMPSEGYEHGYHYSYSNEAAAA